MKKVKLIFAWYDFWMGLFWDGKKNLLYLFPIPMVGFVIDLSKKTVETTIVNKGQSSWLCSKLSRFFGNPIDLYYQCLEKQRYVTVTITKLFIGGRLVIGNGIYLCEKCRSVGLINSQDQVYGYVV